MSLQFRLQQEVVNTEKSDNEAVYDRWQELKSIERQVKSALEDLRKDIDEKMSNGEMVGYPDAMLTLQERESLSCDMDDLVKDLGEKIALRCADVSAAKLRKMIEAGVVPADAPYIKRTVTTALTTKVDRK